jgi:hypothetical protein
VASHRHHDPSKDGGISPCPEPECFFTAIDAAGIAGQRGGEFIR